MFGQIKHTALIAMLAIVALLLGGSAALARDGQPAPGDRGGLHEAMATMTGTMDGLIRAHMDTAANHRANGNPGTMGPANQGPMTPGGNMNPVDPGTGGYMSGGNTATMTPDGPGDMGSHAQMGSGDMDSSASGTPGPSGNMDSANSGGMGLSTPGTTPGDGGTTTPSRSGAMGRM